MSSAFYRSGYESIGNPREQYLKINPNSDEQCLLRGLTHSSCRRIFYHLFCILFLGFPYLIGRWFVNFQALQYQGCSLEQATTILMKDEHDNYHLLTIKTDNVKIPDLGNVNLRFFEFQYMKFIWIAIDFQPINVIRPSYTIDEYLNNQDGLLDTDYNDCVKFYGPNKIEIQVKSYFKLLVEEVLNPFYIFQIFAISLWTFDDYFVYAGCVLFLSIVSISTSLYATRKQAVTLRNLVEESAKGNVTVFRKYGAENLKLDITPSELVPGDLLILPKANFIFPCDAVLLNGECKVNESVLTGESVPVTKPSLHPSEEEYSPEIHKRHTLFAGTFMLQSRNYVGDPVFARVVRTGFETTKGTLVKSMMYPSPIALKYYKDCFKFVLVLFIIAALGTSYCLFLYITRKASIKDIIVRSLDIITIVVPPALPAAMTVGTVYSQSRLKKLKIFCISPPRINVAAKIKLACFDKTGTLTLDGLNIHSVLPAQNSNFTGPLADSYNLNRKDKFLQGMATCHSLTRIGGELAGDPLDLCMFEFTRWILEEPGEDETARFDLLAPTVVKPNENAKETDIIGIIRQFPFSSNVQCMSVICRELGSASMIAFTKGAPERVSKMCLPNTLPSDFSIRLTRYAAKGYRVIALAYKDLPKKFKWKEAQRSKREVIECDLIFLGLLIMQNPLKSETTPIIRTLHQAKIRPVMVTGDNILTAISVARDCEMVSPEDTICILKIHDEDNTPPFFPRISREVIESPIHVNNDCTLVVYNYHYAIDGDTWTKFREYYPNLLPDLLVRGTIFARFQPDQKAQLIKAFQSLDYMVSMVGDGANDCAALKAANVGISLSEAEASVAAPFTSSIPNISCLIHLILEGRCALVTSFAVFKYMALYSLIQFFTILILYKHHSILGDMQFLFIDLIITTTLAVTIGHQGPSRHLGVKRPPGSLVSFGILIPLMLQILTCGFIQIAALLYLFQQKWFKPTLVHGPEEKVICWENTVLFTVSCFQYIILALVYSKGKPYRQMLITNFWFLLSAIILAAIDIYLLIDPAKFIATFFEIIYIGHASYEKYLFKIQLLAFPLIHLAIACFIEAGIADRTWFKAFLQIVRRKKTPKNRYKYLLQQNDNIVSYILPDLEV